MITFVTEHENGILPYQKDKVMSPDNVGYIDKVFSFFGIKVRKSFVREVSKLALLTSYTIWNARQEPAWGSEDQPLLII